MKKMELNNCKLTPTEIEAFKALLLAKRNEILADVSCMTTGALQSPGTDLSRIPIHLADLATDNNDQEITLDLMDGERRLLREIDDALERIENGTFGICQGSGAPIPKVRLEAIPWARYCVRYANALEKSSLRPSLRN